MANVELKTISDIRTYQEYIPEHILQDVSQRMTDWVQSGGTMEDDYIQRQFRYLEEVIKTKM